MRLSLFAQSSGNHREGEGANCMILLGIMYSNMQQRELRAQKDAVAVNVAKKVPLHFLKKDTFGWNLTQPLPCLELQMECFRISPSSRGGETAASLSGHRCGMTWLNACQAESYTGTLLPVIQVFICMEVFIQMRIQLCTPHPVVWSAIVTRSPTICVNFSERRMEMLQEMYNYSGNTDQCEDIDVLKRFL